MSPEDTMNELADQLREHADKIALPREAFIAGELTAEQLVNRFDRWADQALSMLEDSPHLQLFERWRPYAETFEGSQRGVPPEILAGHVQHGEDELRAIAAEL